MTELPMSRDAAERLARTWAEPTHQSLTGQVVETSYGWVFGLRVEGLRDEALLFGSSTDVAVERDTGRLLPLPPAVTGWGVTNRERVLEALEAGFRYDWYDVVVESVAHRRTTLSGLLQLELEFVIP